MTGEEEEAAVEITFDFTEQRDEPIELLPKPGPGHPPTILIQSEVMTARWHELTD
ncbi:hypothetical protein GCM10010300_77300 [Streptomyces olivaceoviridis]|uniref:hypothetical protein n=1 Tax=Streptomyces olivaceoviridis TaxID=1921 RepID=UPI00167C095A|nr:hypothetical protein [Streptomyces olivaceoviridis]GGZ22106.1 hypothetical protein GCM10010300_77300 [Streptomyces olivaceoviridis]